MDNHAERLFALRRYIALLRQEEYRLNCVKSSPNATEDARLAADAGLEATAQKLIKADKELRELEKSHH